MPARHCDENRTKNAKQRGFLLYRGSELAPEPLRGVSVAAAKWLAEVRGDAEHLSVAAVSLEVHEPISPQTRTSTSILSII